MTANYRFGRFELRPASRQLLLEGSPITIGARAFDVLLALIDRRERLVTKDELLDLAWPGLVVEENNLQVQISSLRKMLGDEMIKTMPGRGYRFTAEAVRIAPVLQDGPRHNLPHALTRFIGHEADLNVYEQVVAANKLVTLTGAGGCGKTRLAVELASRLLQEFAHGAWFIDLAPMTDAERLPLTVARTLNLIERPGRSMTEVLCEHLADRQILLVLDNCEHLLTGCGNLVATLLSRTDRLHLLATSREALGLPGEQTLSVRSLSCPPADPEPSAPFEEFEAVQLFVDRARLVRSDFGLDAATGPAVAEICRRLDGIPLAIELAAARTKVRSISELRNMMDNRFRLLVGGSKTVPPRQQTLLATIEWSFELLTPDERRLIQRLSIFSGGWTVEAAIAIADEETEQYEMLDMLTHLLDKSLITSHCRENDRTRYSMLETVRQYGLEALAAAKLETTMYGRHLEYFVRLAEQLEPAITNEEIEALDQLAVDLENLLQALRGAKRVPEGSELRLRLVAALGEYWLSLGLLDLGYRLTTEALLKRGADESSPARARALLVAARLAFFLDRNAEARDWGNECLSSARSVHDDHAVAGALMLLASVAIEAGEIEQGIALWQQSLELARERADSGQINRALNGLGTAQEYLGHPEAAVPFYKEALQSLRHQLDARATAISATNLAGVYILLGRIVPAWPVVKEAVDVSSRTRSQFTMQVVLDMVARLAAAVHHWHEAARMLGAAETALKLAGHKRQRDAEFNAAVATVIKKALPEEEFDTAYDAGHALTVEQAIDEARKWLEKSAPALHGESVAEGRTDRSDRVAG